MIALARNFLGYLAFVFMMAVVGCAQLGLAPAQTFDEKLAYAYGTHTAVLQASAAAVSAGTLTAAEGQAVANLADQSRSILDSAHALEGTDLSSATAKLTLATAVLTQVQTYLQQRGIK